MTWTSARPTVPGFYWFQDDRDGQFQIVVLYPLDEWIYVIGLNAQGLFSQGPLGNYDGHWAGPLAPPEEG